MSKFAVSIGKWPSALVSVALALATLVLSSPARLSAQEPATLWATKDVAALDLGPANCLRYPRINGFDFAPDGTPIVGWTQVEGCGGNTWTAWAEERGGAWQAHVFPPPVQGTFRAHEMGLGGDGQPYMFLERHVNSYYDVVVADLRASVAGAPVVVATGEGLGPSCLGTRFRLATVAGQTWPSRALQLSFCSGSGPLRLDGTTLIENFTNRGHDYSVGPSGQPHIAYVDGGGGVYYLRPGRTPVRVATVNRFSDDIGVAEGADGVIHMVVRGFDTTADYDRAYLGYLRSTDDGLTWTYVDRVDANKDQWGLSLQVDAAGKPAVAYWYYNQLTYATRASGAWVKSLVAEPVWENTEWLKQPRLRFDAAGTPHIAYYDWTANRVRVAAPEFYEPPTLVNPGNQNSVAGAAVSLPIAGTVGDGKIRAFMATGLPPGLSIHPTTGVISGTLLPGSAGLYSVTVTISDTVTDVSAQFVWTVTAPPPPLAYPTLLLPGGYSYAASYGVELSYDIVATTTNAGATLLPISHSALPAGATVTAISEAGPPASRTYRFTWTPQPAFNASGALITSRVVCYSITDSTGRAMLGNSCITVTLPPLSGRFAGGSLSWMRDTSHASATTHKVRITFEGAFQRSFAWPSGTPQVGTVLAGLVDLDLSGAGYLDTVTPPFTVTGVNAVDDFITGTAVVDVEIPIAALPITATYAGCCRLSAVRDGNASTAFALSTTINPTATITRSPVSTLAPRIVATVNQSLIFQLPAAAYDGTTNRFAVTPVAQSGLATPHPGAAPFISAQGIVSWTPTNEGLHAVQFTITSVDANLQPKAATAVEVIFDVRPPCTLCPLVTIQAPAAVATFTGRHVSVVVTASTTLAGGTTSIEYTPLPIGAEIRQLTSGQVSTYEVSWTPTLGQPGSFVCFQARDSGANNSFGQTCTTLSILQAQTIGLTGVVRAFSAQHSDMNRPVNEGAAPLPDFVAPVLGADLKPVFDAASGAPISAFDQWFHDVAGVNQSAVHSLFLSNGGEPDPNLYTFSSANWHPIGGANFFTYEAHGAITYQPGQALTFKAAGDMWVFINRQLVPGSNLHGVHGQRTLTVSLDALSLADGESYPVDIFYAHRGATTVPSIQVQLNFVPRPGSPVVVADIPADGFLTTGLSRLGAASVASGQLKLLSTVPGDAAAGWLASEIPLTNGFTLEFEFIGSGAQAEGFAVVAAGAPGLGAGGSELGYGGLDRSIATEFDARQQTTLGDPAYQHLAVHTESPAANAADESSSIGTQPFGPIANAFFNASPQHVRVDYQPITAQPLGWLRVWMNDNLLPSLEALIDRDRWASILNAGGGYLGLTAGRSDASSALAIRSARLTIYPGPAPSNRPPTLVQPLADLARDEDAADVVINVAAAFTDPDGDALTFTALSSNPGVVSVAMNGGMATLHLGPDAFGSAIISVSAADSLVAETTTFLVDVTAVNDPPAFDAIPDQEVRSGSALVLPLANLRPGPVNEMAQAVTVSVTSSDPAVTGSIVVSGSTFTIAPPVRTTTVTVTITVLAFEVAAPSSATSRTFLLKVVAAGNTPAGNNVTAQASAAPDVPAIKVTFSKVTEAGQTTATKQTSGLEPPAGFDFGLANAWYDIVSTAKYEAPLRVCLAYSADQFTKPSTARLFHYEAGRWVDRTLSVDTTARQICGEVGSLSPFALAESEDLEGSMQGDGSVEAGGKDYRFDFRIAERRLGDERGRLSVTIATPKSGKKKEARDEFESKDISAINFWNDPAFKPSRWRRQRPAVDSVVFTGTGKWNGQRGYTFEAKATDQGEAGRGRDRFSITIRNAQGAVVAMVDEALERGNIQSERLRAAHWR